MNGSLSYRTPSYASRDQTRTLFGQTMGYVAVTAGVFALGTYLGRDMTQGWALVWFVAALACLIGMQFAVRNSGNGLTVGLLLAFGLAMGLAMAPTVVYYASTNPSVVWQAGGATALFMAGLGAFGYATKRDLSAVGRISFFALIGLIIAGIVMIFVRIPGGNLLYSVIGLVVFAGLTAYDFQRLRQTTELKAAPLLAASIFVDALNVFLFFLRIFGGRD
jgi:FtsH-binding integral membrane protein